MFKNIGLEFIERIEVIKVNRYRVFDKNLFKDCLSELIREYGDVYNDNLWKELYKYNKENYIVIFEDHEMNILIKHSRINKLKMLENV